MQQQGEQVPVSPESLQRGYDGETPVRTNAFVIGVVGFIVFAAVIYLSMWGVMRGFAAHEDENSARRASPLATTQPVPPQPWLQPSIAQGDEPRQPWQDMQAFRQHEQDTLDSYGKMDDKTGAARIPIDRAMHLVVERGLPTTQPMGGGR